MKIETRELKNGGTLTMVKTNSMSFNQGDVVLVTDPCYWFDDEDKESGFDLWQEFCNMMFPDNWSELPKEEKLYDYCFVKYVHPNGDETEFLFTSTAYGDGGYICEWGDSTKGISGGSVSVDAGCFAVVLLSSAKRFEKFGSYDESLETDHGSVFEFYKDGVVYVDGSNMTGAIECYTDGSDEEEELCYDCGESLDWCDCDEDDW